MDLIWVHMAYRRIFEGEGIITNTRHEECTERSTERRRNQRAINAQSILSILFPLLFALIFLTCECPESVDAKVLPHRLVFAWRARVECGERQKSLGHTVRLQEVFANF